LGISNSHQSKNKLVVIEEEEEKNLMVVVGLSKEVGRRSNCGWKLVAVVIMEKKKRSVRCSCFGERMCDNNWCKRRDKRMCGVLLKKIK
jgi:hypothetical protein